MEIKQYYVKNGVAKPVNPFDYDSTVEYTAYERFAKEAGAHTYATNAQEGVYDADKMELVTQWNGVGCHFSEWDFNNELPYKYRNGWVTRQFLQLKPIPKMGTTELPSPESYDNLKRQLNTQEKHKDSIRDCWLSCSESKKEWVEAIEEYFSGEHTEIKTFEEFKYQFDLD